MEIWKDIIGYKGYYQISNMGRVRGLDRYSLHKEGGNQLIKGKILKRAYYSNGYTFVGLSKFGKVKQFLLHRLVAKHFIKNINNYPDVNHKFGIKDDNRASQLEWCTQSQNMIHAINTGLLDSIGGKNPYAHPVKIVKNGEERIFETQRMAAKFIGVKDINIHTAKRTGYNCKGYKIYDL